MRLMFFVCLFFVFIQAKTQNKQGTGLPIAKAANLIKIDGVLDEPEWINAAVATGFHLNYPTDSLQANFQTEVRLTFNHEFFYVSFVCYDDDRPNVVQSLRRDIQWELNDNVGMYLDPFNDYTNGFYFTITPNGVQSEGIMSGGGASDDSYNNNWDNKWYSATKKMADRWVAELAIPFKSFRYNKEIQEWNITFVRQDLKRNQVSSWIATPIQYIPASFAYSGKLQWKDNPPHTGTNISVIPYAVTSLSKNNEEDTKENSANVGFDAKVAVTPSLNLDLTVNPDFSTVEVDRQVINLTRFEFQFPERRQFFLENSDLFDAPGFSSLTQPFFSRRLGIASDTSGNLQRVPVAFGARLSGKLGQKWRLGIMNLQTKEIQSLGLPAQNYSVGVLQKQIFERSNFDVFIINKESIGLGQYDRNKFYHSSLLHEVDRESLKDTVLNKFNRVVGFDFNLLTSNNKWSGKTYYHHSFNNFSTKQAYSYGGYANYNTRNWNVMVGTIGLGKDFTAEAGFVPSLAVYPGLFGGITMVDYKLYPKSGPLVLINPGFTYDTNFIPDGTRTDRTITLRNMMPFRNTSSLTVNLRNIFQKLPVDFDLLYPVGDSVLLEGQEFKWNEFELKYNSNTRRLFTYTITTSGGEFYNGHRIGVGANLSYRIQPFGSISVNTDYNRIVLPEAYGTANFLLVSPRFDFTFTNNIFLTTFLQYNDRFDNVNLNARFQWRYKPASDFFVVYTENYLPGNLGSKNRALVFKLTYWLNI